jgi:hypothetical protein
MISDRSGTKMRATDIPSKEIPIIVMYSVLKNKTTSITLGILRFLMVQNRGGQQFEL